MPVLLSQWAEFGGWSAIAAVVVFIGALAAIMSTADSCLLSLGALVAQDLLGLPRDQPKTTKVGKFIAALLLLSMIPIALQRDITLWRLIEIKMELLIQCVPAFLLALHWRRLDATATLAGVVAGTAFSLGLTYAEIPRIGGVHVGVFGLGLNGLVAVAGSFFRRAA
jgi:Na+/proline symporter